MLRTSRPVFTSGRTTLVADAANKGIVIVIIRQNRTNMFSLTRVVVKVDDTILAVLSKLSRAGWVLTGGRSSRMGTDKALLEVDGRPLALRVADEITKVCGSVTLVGDPARYASLGLPVVPDRFADQGPLAGIEAALSASEADWNLVVACDMPSLNAASIEALFAEAEASPAIDAIDVVVPEHSDGKREPLCAVYHRRCAPAVREALDAGTRAVTAMQASLAAQSRLRYVRVDWPEEFANLNTPEDVTRYRNG
jgi:molybdopterin-guanine dinucleotide biosynthesis protein A